MISQGNFYHRMQQMQNGMMKGPICLEAKLLAMSREGAALCSSWNVLPRPFGLQQGMLVQKGVVSPIQIKHLLFSKYRLQ